MRANLPGNNIVRHYMKGLRFYRSSVSERKTESGFVFFSHSQIENNRSDFDYIFKPIYGDLAKYYLLINDQVRFPDNEDEPKLYQEVCKFIIEESDTYYVLNPKILTLIGYLMPEFEGNRLVFAINKPLQMNWTEYCNYEDKNLDNIEVILSNWDGVFWDIYSKNENLLDILIARHRDEMSLEIYEVDYNEDYPEPKRKKEELQHA